MTAKKIRLLAEFLNGLLQQHREGITGDSYNGEALSQIKNILFSNLELNYLEALKLIGQPSANCNPWTRIKNSLTKHSRLAKI